LSFQKEELNFYLLLLFFAEFHSVTMSSLFMCNSARLSNKQIPIRRRGKSTDEILPDDPWKGIKYYILMLIILCAKRIYTSKF